MNTRQVIQYTLLAASLAVPPLARGADLAEVYQRALQNNPQIREAEATRLAALEAKPQALASLLPQLNADGSYSQGDSREAGFRPYWHQRVPPNDGGIAVGQLAVAAALARRGETTAVVRESAV